MNWQERADLEELTDELCDTYGGNFTYRRTFYRENEDGSYSFFEDYYGHKDSEIEEIWDSDEIADLTSRLSNLKQS